MSLVLEPFATVEAARRHVAIDTFSLALTTDEGSLIYVTALVDLLALSMFLILAPPTSIAVAVYSIRHYAIALLLACQEATSI